MFIMGRKSCSSYSSRISYVAYLLIKLLIITAVEARLKNAPTDTIAQTGEDVRFRCSTESLDSVDWTYRKDESRSYRNIFIGRIGGGGDKSNGYLFSQRIVVDVDIPSGQYDLIIRDVTHRDEGEYVCFDISDQDSPARAKLTVVMTGESKAEFCSYDVAASVGSEVQLNFTTTQSHSIHLEHRSIGVSYPLHVFRDGKIVNDYYVLSGRYDVKVSEGVWTLVIKDVQIADAGTFICSEDNGLGKQDVKELVVLEWNNISDEEMCTAKNCTVRYAGNCPPLLEWRQDSTDGENRVVGHIEGITTQNKSVVTSTRIEDGDQKRSSVILCVAMTKSTADHDQQRSGLVIHKLGLCEETSNSIAVIVSIIVISFVFLAILLLWFIKRKTLRCRSPMKPVDDVSTPARQPMKGSSFVVTTSPKMPAVHQPLMISRTPLNNANDGVIPGSTTRKRNQNSVNKENKMNADTVSYSNGINNTPVNSANGSDVQGSSIRRRNQKNVIKENVVNGDSVSNSNRKHEKNGKAKRKLPLEASNS